MLTVKYNACQHRVMDLNASQRPDLAAEDARFAKSMRSLREKLDMSQGDMTAKLRGLGLDKFHQTTVSRIEKGERPVRIGEARVIASALGSTVSAMTAPSEEATTFQRLSAEVHDFVAARRSLTRAEQTLLQHRDVLEACLNEVQELPGWADEDLRLQADLLVERARMEMSDVDWSELRTRAEAPFSPPTPDDLRATDHSA